MSTYTDLHNRIKENVTILRKPGSKDDGMSPQKVILINPENQFYGTFNGAMNIKSGTLSDLAFVGGTIDGTKIKNATFLDGDVEVPIGEIAAAVDSHEQRLTQAEADIKAISAAHDALSAGLSSAVDDLSAGIEEKIDAAVEDIDKRISGAVGGLEDLSSDVIGLSTALSDIALNGVVYKGTLSAYHDKYDSPGQLFGDNPACCLLEGRQTPLKNGWMWRVHVDPANVSGYVVVEDKTGQLITLGEGDYIIIKSHNPSEHEVIPDGNMLLGDFDVINAQDGDDAKLSVILKLSSEVMGISAEISGLSADIAEDISSAITAQIDAKFVHKDGDRIDTLTVDNDLVVDGSLCVVGDDISVSVTDDGLSVKTTEPIAIETVRKVTVSTPAPLELSASRLLANFRNTVELSVNDGLAKIQVNGKSIQSTLDDLSNALDASKFDKDFGEQVSSQVTAIQKYVDELSGAHGSEGIIKDLSDEISVLRRDEKFELQLNKLAVSNNDLSGQFNSIGHFLSAILQQTTNVVRNNTGYFIELNAEIPLSTKIQIADEWSTALGHGDVIYIHELSSIESAPIRIPFAELKPYNRFDRTGNTFILQAGVSRYEFAEQVKSLDDEIETRKSDDAFLSNAISSKIWIEDRANDPSDISGYSDLSVVKISKDEYDSLAIGPTRLCANVLYVVESDYVDAYGQEIRNVLSADGETNAATVGQVGAAKAELCTYAGEISAQASRELSGKLDLSGGDMTGALTITMPNKESSALKANSNVLLTDRSALTISSDDGATEYGFGEIKHTASAGSGEVVLQFPEVSGVVATTNAVVLSQFKSWYPNGSVENYSECTPMWDGATGLKYELNDIDKTALVLPFSTGGENNSHLAGQVVIPPYVVSNDVKYTVAGIKDGWYSGDQSALVEVIAPTTVTSVGSNAFDGCKALTKIYMPGVVDVYRYAFVNCTILSAAELPALSAMHNAGDENDSRAFQGCTALEKIALPSVVNVGNSAFLWCRSLKEIIIPSTNNISSWAFNGCTALEDVDFGDTRSTVAVLEDVNAFNGVPTSCKIVVPDNIYDAWIAPTIPDPDDPESEIANNWHALMQAGYEFLHYSDWQYARKYELAGKRDYMDLSYNTTETVELPALHATMTSQQGGQVIVEYDLLCTKDVPNPPQIGDIYTWRADSAAFYITQGVSVYQTRWILYSYTGEELGGVTTQNATQGFYPDVEFRPSNAVITIHKTTVQKQVTNEDMIALESKTVPTVRTVNGKPLSADVELTGADIAYNASTTIAAKLQQVDSHITAESTARANADATIKQSISEIDSAFAEHVADKNNPHEVTKAQIIQVGSITTADIASKAVTNDKLADNSVSDSKLQGDGNNGITSTHFKTNAFHGAKLVDGTVTAVKLGEDVDAKFASKSDATLTERGPNKDGFEDWVVVVSGGQAPYPYRIAKRGDQWVLQEDLDGEGEWTDAGNPQGTPTSTRLVYDFNRLTYTATRTALQGYCLGPDEDSNPNHDKPLASEAEAEVLRTQLEQKLSVDNTPANVNMVHISQEKYEQLVFDGDALSNTLYVVSGEYINAYGQPLKYLSMTDDPEESEAATQHYVLSGLSGKQDTIADLADIRLSAQNALPASISSNFVLKSQIQGALSAISADPLSGLTSTSMLSDVISSVVVVRNMLSALMTAIS